MQVMKCHTLHVFLVNLHDKRRKEQCFGGMPVNNGFVQGALLAAVPSPWQESIRR